MLIRSWGSRGSIAVSGFDYLKYGGDTTCIEIKSDSGDLIIIDAGTGIRNLGNNLSVKSCGKIHMLLTHAHWDHLSGFPFFKPIYNKKCVIEVWGPQTTQDSVRNIVGKTMEPPYFPIDLDYIHADIDFFDMKGDHLTIGSVQITAIPLNHTNQGAGYKFEEGGKSFVFLTDNELFHAHPGGSTRDEFVEFCRDVDILFHDAEYTPEDYKKTKGWGHSRYTDAIDLGLEAGVHTLGLFHHNQDRTDKEVDAIEKDCKRILKEKKATMRDFAVATGTEIVL